MISSRFFLRFCCCTARPSAIAYAMARCDAADLSLIWVTAFVLSASHASRDPYILAIKESINVSGCVSLIDRISWRQVGHSFLPNRIAALMQLAQKRCRHSLVACVFSKTQLQIEQINSGKTCSAITWKLSDFLNQMHD